MVTRIDRRPLRYLFLLFVLVPFVRAAADDPVRVEGGLLAGVPGEDPSVRAYKGIPFAAPPVGDLRWQPPQPPAPWDGVRTADHYAPVCMQQIPPPGSFYHTEFFQQEQPMDEDCLYLNVWTAAEDAGERRPVMLWIYGGGFNQGSGSDPTFDGEALAKKGVVLVTINYRVGPFGFLAHPELSEASEHGVSGNYGILDQIAALEWVRKNIAAFGGDPGNVTVFGQSAGAMSVNILTVSPLAKGLFHRAIGQSGSMFAFGESAPLADVEQAGVRFAEAMGAPSLEALRALPADSVLNGPPGFWRPSVDGRLLPATIYELYAEGRQNDVPLMVGATANEGTTLMGPTVEAEAYQERIRQQFDEQADAYLALYPGSSDDEAWRSQVAALSDRIAWGAERWAQVQIKTGTAPVYVYSFERVPPGRESERYGAWHSSELVFVFDNLKTTDRPWTPDDEAIADAMASAWVRFATTGDPNGGDLPTWPAYEPGQETVMAFDVERGMRVTLEPARRAFYDAQFERARASQE